MYPLKEHNCNISSKYFFGRNYELLCFFCMQAIRKQGCPMMVQFVIWYFYFCCVMVHYSWFALKR